MPGVIKAAVNLATERADVTFEGSPDPQAVITAIKLAGYDVARQKIEVGIEGMTCASCVRRVEKAIAGLPGVLSASVNLATEKATVEVLAGVAGLAEIEAAIRKAGYEPRRLEASAAAADAREEAKDQELRQLEARSCDRGQPDTADLPDRDGLASDPGSRALDAWRHRAAMALCAVISCSRASFSSGPACASTGRACPHCCEWRRT